MAAFWEIAAHSAYNMFSYYKYLIVNLVFFPLRLLEWEFLSDCTVNTVLMCKIAITYQHASRAVCAYAHAFLDMTMH